MEAFSVAGIDETNDQVRKGTEVAQIFRSIEELSQLKARYGSDLPKIYVAYMLFRSGLEGLGKVRIFRGAPA